jgi:hypothetical protein
MVIKRKRENDAAENITSSSSSSSSASSQKQEIATSSSSSSSLSLESSEVNIGRGIKWTTATLPQLQLKCFDADIVDTHLEARKLLIELM